MNEHARNQSVLTRGEAAQAISSLLLLIVISGALVVYKSGAALRVLQIVSKTGGFVAAPDLFQPGRPSTLTDVFARSVTYVGIIWPALLFGVLIAAAVRTFVSPAWFARVFARSPIRQQVVAGVAGAPLMLCSCCVAPVFSAVHERSRRLGPSLAVALAAPSLNPAALALTFMLFQPRIATVRLVMALVAVFLVSPAIARAFGTNSPICAEEAPPVRVGPTRSPGLVDFVAACAHVGLRTVPVLMAGVVAAMWVAARLPSTALTVFGPATGIIVAGLLAVPLALPTFFEIPLALTLITVGAPAGAAAAVLFAGPAVNLPSLLAIGRSTGWRVAAALALAIGLVACVGGLLIG